jgi:hypothetical protein
MNLIDIVNNTVTKHGIMYLANYLQVSRGTIKRWLEYGIVPTSYKIDLFKIENIPIDYALLSDKEKDKFYTDIETAGYCYRKLIETLKKYNENINDYIFIEPSVGDGSFYNLIEHKKIGIDIQPEIDNTITCDYLQWIPQLDKKYIVIGNPPFGLRGNLALRFINHSIFADYIAFILPNTFDSDGKGSCKNRVIGFNLIHSETVSPKFHYPNGKNVNVNVVFQIWSKHYKINKEKKTSKSYVDLYSVSDGDVPGKIRNKNMIGKCDFYLPLTCFGRENMKIYKEFNDLPNPKRGYGIIIKKDKVEIYNFLLNTNWADIAFKSTNGALNLRFDLIYNHLTLNGFIDNPTPPTMSEVELEASKFFEL